MQGVQGVLHSKAHRTESVPAVVAAGTLTTIGTFELAEIESLFLGLTVAVDALTGFEVQSRANAADSYVAVANVAGDFTTPNAPISWATGNLVTAAVGSHHVLVDVRGMESIRIQAKSAGTATLALEAGAN